MTASLFTELNVATGEIKAQHVKRQPRVEFLAFMNAVVADYPGQRIDYVLDNVRTHNPSTMLGSPGTRTVHFDFTPTHTAWLNQVEIWFSVLDRNTLKGASFSSVTRLRAATDASVES